MPRPSLKAQRSTEIVDAFAECVSEFGVDRSTLQLVANRAGVHKSIIRHYVGSRTDLVNALVARALGRYEAISEAALAAVGDDPGQRLSAYIDSLFVTEESYEGALFTAVTMPGTEYREAGELVERALERGARFLVELLAAVAPPSPPQVLEEVAEGIGAMSLAAGESMGATPASAERLRLASHRLAATAASPTP